MIRLTCKDRDAVGFSRKCMNSHACDFRRLAASDEGMQVAFDKNRRRTLPNTVKNRSYASVVGILRSRTASVVWPATSSRLWCIEW